MAEIRDVKLARQAQEKRLEPVREFTLAVLIYVDSPDNDAKSATKVDHVWMQELNQPESHDTILNRAVPPVVGLMVKIGYPEKPPFERQVLGVWDGISNLSGYTPAIGGSLSSHPHAQSHQYPSESSIGTDPVLIYQPAVQMLKTTGTGTSTIVTIQGLPSYRYRDIWKSFPGTTLNLFSSIPSAGFKRSVLVYLNAITNTITTVLGTAVANLPAITAPKPALPNGGIASAYVLLTGLDFTITTSTDITDAREFLEPRGNDTTLDATAAGQILISNDGVTLELGIPVVDANGDIVTSSSNGHIVVV